MSYYLQVVKCLMLPWQLRAGTKGKHALECCAAAGAALEAKGDPWSPYGVAKAYAAVKGLDHETVWLNMRYALKKRGLPPPAAAIRFLATSAERMEAEAIAFEGGGCSE